MDFNIVRSVSDITRVKFILIGMQEMHYVVVNLAPVRRMQRHSLAPQPPAEASPRCVWSPVKPGTTGLRHTRSVTVARRMWA